jgi:aryl-alcohol dehydrogenase-like predicted oxidoreductase
MITRKLWDGSEIPALGLGCWAIGGPFYAGDRPLGWGKIDDKESIAAIDCAVDLGVRFFDTAQVYGAGHSETILGKALANRLDVRVGTKVGITFDPETRQMIGEDVTPSAIERSIEESSRRLKRDCIDIVHLHLNSLPIPEAETVFDCLERLTQMGKLKAYGWSTDFPDRAAAFAGRPNFVSIQHAMNIFFRASQLVPVIEQNQLLSIVRSPLAMGVLTGKYTSETSPASDDIRSQTVGWMAYFEGGKINDVYARQLASVQELLRSDGRTLVQGALAWLWARSPNTLPIPGFRTVAQVEDLVGALDTGTLSDGVMSEIEAIILREPEGPPRER